MVRIVESKTHQLTPTDKMPFDIIILKAKLGLDLQHNNVAIIACRV